MVSALELGLPLWPLHSVQRAQSGHGIAQVCRQACHQWHPIVNVLAVLPCSAGLTPLSGICARRSDSSCHAHAGQQGGADAQQLLEVQGDWRRQRRLLGLELGALLAPLQSPEDVRPILPSCSAVPQTCAWSACFQTRVPGCKALTQHGDLGFHV